MKLYLSNRPKLRHMKPGDANRLYESGYRWAIWDHGTLWSCSPYLLGGLYGWFIEWFQERW